MPQNVENSGLSEVVREWSRNWGEVTPRDILWVRTTRDQAMRLLYDDVGSTEEAIYLVTLRGDFSMLVDTGKSLHGVWAALFIDAREMRVRTFTVRPEEFIPEFELSGLGEVGRI